MSYSESEYETYSDDSFNSDESSVKEREKKYSTTGITLDNPFNYRRKSINKKQQEKTEDTSEYTDDTTDSDYSIGSISDDSDDIKDKKLSDREKLQILEEQLAKGKNQSPKHKGRYTESEDESDYDDSEFDTESDNESDNAKIVKKTSKKNIKQKTTPFEDYDDDYYDSETESELEEETGSEEEEDDYTTFLMKQLQKQQEYGKINMEDTYVKESSNVVNEEDETVYAENSTSKKQNQNIDIKAKMEEVSTSKTLLESRTGSRHSLQSSETEKDDEKDLCATSTESTKLRNCQTKATEDGLKSKNMFSNDQYKLNSDYPNNVNGAEEQKLESSQYENMQGNGGNNSESELNLNEAERRDDKSDKTSMKGFDVDSSSCGNEKGEKSNLNSNRRRSGKHTDPGTDGDHGESISLDSFPSELPDNTTGQRASAHSGQSKSKGFKAHYPSAVSPHGGFDEENADQAAVGLSQMDLKSDLQSLNKDKMSESVSGLNVKGDNESVTPGKDESRDAESRLRSKEPLPNVNEDEGPSPGINTTKPLNSAVENSEEILDTKTEVADNEDDTQREMKEESKKDSPQQNSNERTDANDDDTEKDGAIYRRNSTTSSQIDDKVIETVSKENNVNYLSRRVSGEMDFRESVTDLLKDDRGGKERPEEYKDDNKPNDNDLDPAQSLEEEDQGSSKVKSNPDLKNDDKSQEVDENKTTKVVPSRWKYAAKVAVLKESNSDKNDLQTPSNDAKDKQSNLNIETEDSEKNNKAENVQNHDEMKDREDVDDGIHAEKETDKKKTTNLAPSRWKNAAKNAVSKDAERDRKNDQMAENDADDKHGNADGEVDGSDKDTTAECEQDSEGTKDKDGDNDKNYVENRQHVNNAKSVTSNQADDHTGDRNKTPDRNNKEAGEYPNHNGKENGEDTDINASKNSFESIEREIKEDTSSSTNSLEKSSTPVKEVDELTTKGESNNKAQYNSVDVDSGKRQEDRPSSTQDSSTSPRSIQDGGSVEQTHEPNNETVSNKHGSQDSIMERSEKKGSQSTASVSSNKSALHIPVPSESPHPEDRSTGQAENSDKGENTEENGKMLKDPHQSSESPADDNQPSSSPDHQEHRSEHTVKRKLSRSTSRVSLKSTTSRKSTKSKSSATKRNSVSKSRASLRTTRSKSSIKESERENKDKKEKETNDTKSEKSDTFRKENDRDSTSATVEEREMENKQKVSKSRISLQSKSNSKDNSMESSPDESAKSSVKNNDKKAEDLSEDDLKVLSNKMSLEEDEKSEDRNEDNTQIKTSVESKEQSDDRVNAKGDTAMKDTNDKNKTKEVTSDGVSQENNNSNLKPTEDDLSKSETSPVSEKKDRPDEHDPGDKTMETKNRKSPIKADAKPHTAEKKSGTMGSQESLSSKKHGETKDDSESSKVTENEDDKPSKEKDAEF